MRLIVYFDNDRQPRQFWNVQSVTLGCSSGYLHVFFKEPHEPPSEVVTEYASWRVVESESDE